MASVVTDASGNMLGENRYYPYGETRFTSGTIYTDKLFPRWVEPAVSHDLPGKSRARGKNGVEIGQREIRIFDTL